MRTDTHTPGAPAHFHAYSIVARPTVTRGRERADQRRIRTRESRRFPNTAGNGGVTCRRALRLFDIPAADYSAAAPACAAYPVTHDHHATPFLHPRRQIRRGPSGLRRMVSAGVFSG